MQPGAKKKGKKPACAVSTILLGIKLYIVVLQELGERSRNSMMVYWTMSLKLDCQKVRWKKVVTAAVFMSIREIWILPSLSIQCIIVTVRMAEHPLTHANHYMTFKQSYQHMNIYLDSAAFSI